METITFENDFHKTSATIRLRADGVVTERTVRRVRRELCPWSSNVRWSGCACGNGAFKATRQDSGRLYWDRGSAGGGVIFEDA